MSNLKNKVSETAEQVKNAVTETVDKVGHAATEALHKGDRALSDMARKAVGLAADATGKLKEVTDKVAAMPEGGAPANGNKVKNAGDTIKKVADKTKNGAH